MANDTGAVPAVPLFQRAHARMVLLQKIDEQLVTLLQQRGKILDELHDVQSKINSEFERVTSMDENAPAKIMATIQEIAHGNMAAATPQLAAAS